MALTTVVDKLKDKTLNISKSTKSDPNKNKLKGNQSQSGNNNSKCKSKGKKFLPKDNWKLEAPKQGEAQTKKMDKKTYHWCPHHSCTKNV